MLGKSFHLHLKVPVFAAGCAADLCRRKQDTRKTPRMRSSATEDDEDEGWKRMLKSGLEGGGDGKSRGRGEREKARRDAEKPVQKIRRENAFDEIAFST